MSDDTWEGTATDTWQDTVTDTWEDEGAAGGSIATPDDLEHTHTLDTSVIIQSNNISLNDLEHAHNLDLPSLIQKGIITANGCQHTHNLDAALIQVRALAFLKVFSDGYPKFFYFKPT